MVAKPGPAPSGCKAESEDLTSAALCQFLAESPFQKPAQTALVDTRGAWTYGELWEAVEQKAQAFREAGLQPGEAVLFSGESNRDFVAGALALATCDALVLPWRWDRPLAPELFQHFPASVIIDEKPHQRGPVISRKAEPNIPFPEAKGAAFARFTSGSSGRPKGVLLDDVAIRGRILSAREGLGLDAGDAVWHLLDLADHLHVSLFTFLYAGARVHLFPWDGPAPPSTVLYGAPAHFAALTRSPDPPDFSRLRLALSTSLPLSNKRAQAFQERFGQPVRSAYGLIEMGLPLLSGEGEVERLENLLPGYAVRVVREDGGEAEPGETGELHLLGPGLFLGYFAPWKKAEALLKEGWYPTGDMVRREETGWTLRGRKGIAMEWEGRDFYPEEAERVLRNAGGDEGLTVSLLFEEGGPGLFEIQPGGAVALDETKLREALTLWANGESLPLRFCPTPSNPGGGNKPRRLRKK